MEVFFAFKWQRLLTSAHCRRREIDKWGLKSLRPRVGVSKQSNSCGYWICIWKKFCTEKSKLVWVKLLLAPHIFGRSRRVIKKNLRNYKLIPINLFFKCKTFEPVCAAQNIDLPATWGLMLNFFQHHSFFFALPHSIPI